MAKRNCKSNIPFKNLCSDFLLSNSHHTQRCLNFLLYGSRYVIISKVKRESIQYVSYIVIVLYQYQYTYYTYICSRFISSTEPYNNSQHSRNIFCQNNKYTKAGWCFKLLDEHWEQSKGSWGEGSMWGLDIDMQCWGYKQKYRLNEVCGNSKGYKGVLLVSNCAKCCCWNVELHI